MLKQKVRIHHIPIALAVFAVVTASSFFALNILAQTISTSTSTNTSTYSPPICSFTYSSWSPCDSSGTQTRSVVSATPSGCAGGNPETSRSCTYTAPITVPTCTSHTCSEWSACSLSGKQTRSCSYYPAGCQGGDTANTSAECTYIPPTTVPTCTSHTCSEWSACSSSGKQTRSCAYYPSGCQGGDTANTSMDCVYTSPNITLNCDSNCSSWSDCGQDGYQIRNCTAALGCPNTNWTEKKFCASSSVSSSGSSSSAISSTTTSGTSTISSSCAYQCSSWSGCNSSGYQSRTCQKPSETACTAYEDKQPCVYSSSASSEPSSTVVTNCSYMCSAWSVCSPAGIKSQSCWPAPAGCSGENKTVTQSCVPTTCSFYYSDWGACAGGYQYRSILKSYPQGCVGGSPDLMKGCVLAEMNGSESAAVSETPAVVSMAPVDPDNSVNVEWKKDNFKTGSCPDQICGGSADPDKDGLSNNDEFRYGTNPANRDTDNDGKTDGEEVAAGTNPLKSSAKGEPDAIIYESPKAAGTVKTDVYKVTNVEMSTLDGGAKQLKITGKGPAESYINIYIYSGDPIIVTVKTDSNGDWTYNVDRELDDGNHEVYVAVTNNSGAIKAKSEPLPFVKTAQSVSMAQASKNNVVEPADKAGISIKKVFYILAFGFFAVVLAFILLGLVIKKLASKTKLN